MLSKEYTLGLDIGTHSVGWAVIDENNNLVKKFGHYLWGVRMFEESSDAKARRNFRCGRRRYQRRRERIEFLRGIFKSEIEKLDKDFFTRLDDSFYLEEDSRIPSKNLFENFLTNSEYNKKYGPTIWHLRKRLIENTDEKVDPRLLYLVCHHIIKYRGNFLSDVNEFNVKDSSSLVSSIEQFNESIRKQREQYEASDIYGSEAIDGVLDFLQEIENPSLELVNKIEEIINNTKIIVDGNEVENRTKTDKKKNLTELLGCKGKVGEVLFVQLLVTGNVKFESLKIFKDRAEKPSVKIDFSNENFDELIRTSINDFPSEYGLLSSTLSVKAIFERFYLKKLIGKNKFISYAMVDKFNVYKKDLATLKKLIKTYLPEKYTAFFRETNSKVNYVAYTGSTNYHDKNTNKQHKEYVKRIDEESFFKEVKKYLAEIKTKLNAENFEESKTIDSIDEIIRRIDEEGSFLQRIRSKHNGALPYQLHKAELMVILSNQAKYYQFLNVGEPTNSQKIISLLTFKRPYFIGPIAGHGDNKWAIFKNGKENERAYPWNFEDVVDYDASAEEFIHRMQNKCTYLKGEEDYCLPQHSIIYQAFNVFNYINKIKVYGGDIDKELKQRVLDLFLNNKSVTATKIKKVIDPTNPGAVVVSECNVTLSSYVTFNNVIPEFKDKVRENILLIEDLIKNVALFEDKTILEKRIRELCASYNFTISEDSVKKIKSFSFKGYGRLCKKLLLELPFSNVESGEIYDGVVKALSETTNNFMQIYHSDKFNLKNRIDEYNQENSSLKKFADDDNAFYEYVKENLMVSPCWIRPYVQTFSIVQEVEKILGTKISYFAIECTREEDVKNKKKRTDSRRDQIDQMYESAKEFVNELNSFHIDLKHLNNELNYQCGKRKSEEEVEKSKRLRADKLFLYFQQLGKDIYTLEPIDINNLDKEYDIDHIYPQSLIKDDSLSNRVLTKKSKNNYKQNKLLPELAQEGFLAKGAYKFYELLYKNKMISKVKYQRLTEKEVNENAINDFCARQLTSTNQAVSALIDALRNFKGVDEKHIIFSRASIVHQFREGNNIYKSREANNFHHAHDAYLNAFLGKVVQRYFNGLGQFFKEGYDPKNFFEEDKDDNKYTRNTSKLLSGKRRWIPQSDSPIWNGYQDIKRIRDTIYNNFDIRETHKTLEKNAFISQVTNGGKNGKSNVPVKSHTPNGNDFNMKKYGGYGSPAYMYMQIFKCTDKKGGVSFKLIPINKLYEKNKDAYLKERLPKGCKYCCVDDNLNIRFGSVFQDGKKEYRITGCSGSSYVLLNNKERFFTKNTYNTIYFLGKYFDKLDKKENVEFVIDEKGCKCVLHRDKQTNEIKLFIDGNDLINCFNELVSKYQTIYSYNSINKSIEFILQNCNVKAITTSDDFQLFCSILKELIGVYKVNTRNSIDLTKTLSDIAKKDMESKKIKISSASGVLTSGTELNNGVKIYAYSPTGFYRKLLFEVK